MTRALAFMLAFALGAAGGCSAFGPDDREHRYELRLSADRTTTIDYELEVFADNDGAPVRVTGLFRRDVAADVTRQELNEVATSSPGFLGVKVEGARLERLIIGAAGGAVTAELLMDGEVRTRATASGAGGTISDLRVGRTF